MDDSKRIARDAACDELQRYAMEASLRLVKKMEDAAAIGEKAADELAKAVASGEGCVTLPKGWEASQFVREISGWQPIETAPKDGRQLLLGFWVKGGWVIRQAKYMDVGWYTRSDYLGFLGYTLLSERFKATHWMPSPEPPEIDRGEEKT